MKTVQKKLSELRRPEKNVRMHSTKQLTEFRRSIEMFGQIRPIVVDESGTILAGNGLYDALLSMGREQADCYVVCNLTEKEKKKLMLADNRVFSLGVDDMAAFDEIIAELGTDLDVPGYDQEMLESLVADVGDVDELIGGYGIISEQDKSSMEKAVGKYEAEEKEFIQSAEEVAPRTLPAGGSTPSPVALKPVDESTPGTEERPTEAPAEPLQRKYIVCPKCGEKIWL